MLWLVPVVLLSVFAIALYDIGRRIGEDSTWPIWLWLPRNVFLVVLSVSVVVGADELLAYEFSGAVWMVLFIGVATLPFSILWFSAFFWALGHAAGHHFGGRDSRASVFAKNGLIGLILLALLSGVTWSGVRSTAQPDGRIRITIEDVTFRFPYFGYVNPNQGGFTPDVDMTRTTKAFIPVRGIISVEPSPGWQARCEDELARQPRCEWSPPPADFYMSDSMYGDEDWNTLREAFLDEDEASEAVDLENGWKVYRSYRKNGDLYELTAFRGLAYTDDAPSPAVIRCRFDDEVYEDCDGSRAFSPRTRLNFPDYTTNPTIDAIGYSYAHFKWNTLDDIRASVADIDRDHTAAEDWLRQFQVR